MPNNAMPEQLNMFGAYSPQIEMRTFWSRIKHHVGIVRKRKKSKKKHKKTGQYTPIQDFNG